MNLNQLASQLKESKEYENRITCWKELPAREAKYKEFPATINNKLLSVLQEKGITKLYSHQAQSYNIIQKDQNLIVVTPTASGKTLCYNLPILDTILQDD